MPSSAGSNGVEIVTIGDELLLGFTVDTNAAHLARTLAALGVTVVRRATVGDDPADIVAGVREALDRTGAVITTGGLGPTSDDRSKAAIAELFGRGMELDQPHLEWMRDRWRTRFNREMPEANIRQAMMPVGARKLENRHGSAPGVWLEDERGRWVAMLPGVPREMRGMLGDTLVPLLRDRLQPGTVVKSRTLRTTGVAESLLGDQIERSGTAIHGDVAVAYLPSTDGVDIRLTVRHRPESEADALLADAAVVVRGAVGDAIYAEGDVSLAATLLDLCRTRGVRLAVAESCTGGLLGARLTAVPGSSDVVVGGVIAYDNAVKQRLLGVSADDLTRDGAVSESVVRQMAVGASELIGADIGLAVTGVAGPGGGTADKPVGTVWVAVSIEGAVQARLLKLWGDRDEIRIRSAQAVMTLARRALLGLAE